MSTQYLMPDSAAGIAPRRKSCSVAPPRPAKTITTTVGDRMILDFYGNWRPAGGRVSVGFML